MLMLFGLAHQRIPKLSVRLMLRGLVLLQLLILRHKQSMFAVLYTCIQLWNDILYTDLDFFMTKFYPFTIRFFVSNSNMRWHKGISTILFLIEIGDKGVSDKVRETRIL